MGPMFAGKTTMLLKLVAEAEQKDQRVALITNALDKRYGEKQFATHSGMSRPALAVRQLQSLLDERRESNWHLDNFDVIAIDESQFFPDLFDFCVKAVDEKNKTVIAAGLSGDFERNMFGDIVRLVPHADEVAVLKARCAFCDEPAPFTLRLVANEEQELVGGKDQYQPVCRHHYELLSDVRRDFRK